jgi:hypothetical protein
MEVYHNETSQIISKGKIIKTIRKKEMLHIEEQR